MTIDRRRSPRIEILDRIHGHIAAFNVKVVVREMSLGGMSIETPFAFPIGAEHEFRLELGDESTVLLRGRVVRCIEVPGEDGAVAHRAAIQFLDDEPDTDDGVSGLLDRIK
jgi:hypothetical protein